MKNKCSSFEDICTGSLRLVLQVLLNTKPVLKDVTLATPSGDPEEDTTAETSTENRDGLMMLKLLTNRNINYDIVIQHI